MVDGASMARFASVLADRSRATICVALLDGRAWTAGELARHVGVGQSTTSEHLSVLVDAGLLAEERQGRHRYVRLAGPDVAQLVEDLASVAGADEPGTGLRAVRVRRDLAAARTCYDHLAGRLGVAVYDAMVARGLVTTRDGLSRTPKESSGWPSSGGRPTTPPGVRWCEPAWTGPSDATTSVARRVPPSAAS